MKKEDLTKAQRSAIADRLAEECLPVIDAALEDVLSRDTLFACMRCFNGANQASALCSLGSICLLIWSRSWRTSRQFFEL